jgi:hypothetical protein
MAGEAARLVMKAMSIRAAHPHLLQLSSASADTSAIHLCYNPGFFIACLLKKIPG